MELTINIDEKEFTKLLEGELANFSEQELHNICRDALMKQLSDPEIFKSLFVGIDSYGYYNKEKYYANDILKEAAKTVDLSPLFEGFQEQVLNYLKENHDDIIKNLMADIFMRGFTDFIYNSNFTERMRYEFNNAMAGMHASMNEKFNQLASSIR